MGNDERERSGAGRRLFMEERQRKILEKLSGGSNVLVSDLSREFGVSEATIRTDMRQLEAAGRLERTRGGAIPVQDGPLESTTIDRKNTNRDLKHRIGQKAVELVSDGDFLLVDSGTTTEAFARCLGERRGLTVLTNDVIVARIVEETVPDASVIMLGGTLRVGFHCTQGTEAVEMLRRYYAPMLFTSTDFASPERGFTTYRNEQAELKRVMFECSDRHVMLADSMKFGANAPIRFADLSDVDVLVTDEGLGQEARDDISSAVGSLVIA